MKKIALVLGTILCLAISSCDKSSGSSSNSTVKVSSVSLSSTTLSLTTGDTEKLTATVSPSNATNKTVSWTSSNTSVATVADGLVTAVGSGTATITAAADGVSSTCDVTVKEAYEGWWKVSSVTINECTYQKAINNNKSILEKFNVLVKKVSDSEAHAFLFDESTSTFKTGFSGKIKSSTCVGDTREESSSVTVLGKTVTTVTTFTFEFNVTGGDAGSLKCLYLNGVNGSESTLADVDFTCARADAPAGYKDGTEAEVSIVTGVPTIDDIKSLLGK